MNYRQHIVLFVLAIGVVGQPTTASDSASVLGEWQPYSETARFIGPITVSPDRIVFEQSGSALPISAERGRFGVYALPDTLAPDARQRIGCGPLKLQHLTLYAGVDGILNMKVYDEDSPPTVPNDANRLAIIGGGCALYNFAR